MIRVNTGAQASDLSFDKEAIKPLFQELITMLNAGLPSAKKRWETCNALLGPDYAVLSDSLQKQIEAYEFEEALSSLLELADSLGIVLEKDI